MMDQHFSAADTRQELRDRLLDTLTSDLELRELVGFLRNDLAYAPDNNSIVGPVLRANEFVPWQALMASVQWDVDWPIEYDADEVRALSRQLLTEMERG